MGGVGVGLEGEECEALLVISAEGFAVHVEEEHAGSVDACCDDDVLCRCWIGGRGEGEVWGCQGEVILRSGISKAAIF